MEDIEQLKKEAFPKSELIDGWSEECRKAGMKSVIHKAS